MRSRSSPYRVLLVDERQKLSALARTLFEGGELLACDSVDYRSMPEAVRHLTPDLVVVDLNDSEDAFVAIESVMASRPTPILVLHPENVDRQSSFLALELGALDVSLRPAHADPAFWEELKRKLILLAQVRVVQHVKGKRHLRSRMGTVQKAGPPFPLVAIAASLGGPRALSVLLRTLPRKFPAPICICQHISDGFTAGLAQWLASETALSVVEAQDGGALIPGTVFVAPSGAHLRVGADWRTHLDAGPAVMGFKPSCDLLLSSVAEVFGRRAVGVVLTGMGRDGAKGLLDIRRHGGRTLAQDEASCVVFGMPGAAVELGAAEEVFPLDQMGPALIKKVESC